MSLPLSPVLTFLTILLPLVAAANATALPYLLREKARSPRRLLVRLAHPAVTQGLQGIIVVVLATLYTTYIVPGAARDCGLSSIWERLFRSKDAQSVKAIQDALECCGFRSVKDMAWPFPPVDVACAQRFDRTLPCQGPWTGALQGSAGVELGVVVIVALLQVGTPHGGLQSRLLFPLTNPPHRLQVLSSRSISRPGSMSPRGAVSSGAAGLAALVSAPRPIGH